MGQRIHPIGLQLRNVEHIRELSEGIKLSIKLNKLPHFFIFLVPNKVYFFLYFAEQYKNVTTTVTEGGIISRHVNMSPNPATTFSSQYFK